MGVGGGGEEGGFLIFIYERLQLATEGGEGRMREHASMLRLALSVTASPLHTMWLNAGTQLPRSQVLPVRCANDVSIDAQGHSDFRKKAALAGRQFSVLST